MQEAKEKHPEIWDEFEKGNFCVTKGAAGFTSIGPDHGIEQENRELKVMGGIVGITQNEKSLDKYFLISPELSKIKQQFEEKYCKDNSDSRVEHHEITGGKLSRQAVNALKLSHVFIEHGNPFESTDDELVNLLSKSVMSDAVTNDILQRDHIGQQMFVDFVNERLIEGKLSVWGKMTKKKLKTFKSESATTEFKSGGNLIKIKEERGLLQRFIVISRSRPDLDLKECIGTYEFGVVPRSLFAADGTLLLAYDKSSMINHLEKYQNAQVDVSEDLDKDIPEQVQTSRDKVVIIDGMAVVNSVVKTDKIKTCADFADSFLSIICNMVNGFDEVRLVFDKYISTSLKSQMRIKRTKGKTTYYHVKDRTLIKNITLKDFLSDVRTKEELTEYLAQKILHHSRSQFNRLKKCIVTYGTISEGNIDVPASLLTHSQEEADTVMLLHAANVPKDVDLVVCSPDTDVLMLLVHMFPMLPDSTKFLTGKGRLKRLISVKSIYSHLGQKYASALLGLHAFTGCDLTGRFGGRTKDSCFKTFLSCDDKILAALADLGNRDLTPDTWAQLERFVCLLYKSKSHTAVKELRWFLFSNRSAEGENLPPTFGSLYFHILRASYVAMVWKNASLNHPCLPSPVNFGWKLDEETGSFSACRCLYLPAPEAVLQLVKCGCKSGCEKRCSCRKNDIPCTEVCSCLDENCTNKSMGSRIEEDCDES